jgi:hypothetical protein
MDEENEILTLSQYQTNNEKLGNKCPIQLEWHNLGFNVTKLSLFGCIQRKSIFNTKQILVIS